MGFWVYILQSQCGGRFYCGHTSDLERRLAQHNDPEYRLSKTTKRFGGPWKVVWSKGCPTRAEAMKLEKIIKKRGIGRYLRAGESAGSVPGEPCVFNVHRIVTIELFHGLMVGALRDHRLLGE